MNNIILAGSAARLLAVVISGGYFDCVLLFVFWHFNTFRISIAIYGTSSLIVISMFRVPGSMRERVFLLVFHAQLCLCLHRLHLCVDCSSCGCVYCAPYKMINRCPINIVHVASKHCLGSDAFIAESATCCEDLCSRTCSSLIVLLRTRGIDNYLLSFPGCGVRFFGLRLLFERK